MIRGMTNQWLPAESLVFIKTVRMDITGERHKIAFLNEGDGRICKTACGIILAWLHGYGAMKEKTDCKECFA